jgi:transposase
MRYTIKDLQKDFPDEDACLEWLKDYLYPDGIHCPNDKKVTPHHKLKNRRAYSCELCGHHTYPTANTIFHKSTTPLTSWFYAVYLMAQTRAGISAKQLERELGVTYKTAWRMFHQIRKMMADDSGMLSGQVEIDETYFQPNRKMRTTAKLGRKKKSGEAVFAIVKRYGKARVMYVKATTTAELFPIIEANVAKDSVVYTDDALTYQSLKKLGYTHLTTKHGMQEYAVGYNHTQNVENLFSTMKRGIRGVYRHVDAKYLEAYANEYAFRYSHRRHPAMFWALLGRVARI